MKKHFSILFVVLAIMAIFTSTVFAAPTGKSASLSSVDYNDGGMVLLFQTSGLSNADLKNAKIYADSNWHPMYCKFVDHTTQVRCTFEKKLAGMGSFRAIFAGFGFWGELPQAKTVVTCQAGETLWYAYNQYYNGDLFYSGTVPVSIWEASVADGFFEMMAQDGYTFKITNAFCVANPI